MKFVQKHVIAVCSVSLLLVFGIIASYNIQKLYTAEKDFSKYHFNTLFRSIANSIEDESQATDAIVRIVSPVIQNTHAIKALLVFSSKNGIEYLRVSNSQYLITDSSNLNVAKAKLVANDGLLYSNTFYTPRGTVFFVEAVYRSIEPSKLQSLIRSLLIIVLISGICITLVFLIQLLCFTPELRKKRAEKRQEKRAVKAATLEAEKQERMNKKAKGTMKKKTEEQQWEEVLLDTKEDEELVVVPRTEENTDDDISAFDFAEESHFAPTFDIDTSINPDADLGKTIQEQSDPSNLDNLDDLKIEDDYFDAVAHDTTRKDYNKRMAELKKNLAVELQRSVFYDYNLSIIVLSVSSVTGDDFDSISEIINSFAPLEEFVFQTGESSYTLILPQSDVHDTWKFATKLFEGLQNNADCTVHLGISSQNKRLIDSKMLLQEAQTALQKAENENRDILAFSPNPEQYRKHLRKISGMDATVQEEKNTFVFEDLAETKAPDVEILLMEEAGNEIMVPRF